LSRRKGRILAFQALYSYDVGEMPLEQLLKLEWNDNENCDEESQDFSRLLIGGTVKHIEEIDANIKNHLTGKWELDRINKVSLAILRLSVYSLMFQKDTPPSIVIDEAIDIAKEYGADDAFKFINAVLDSIRKELNPSDDKKQE